MIIYPDIFIMIVSYKENGWNVVTQRSHGLLAAQLAFHWQTRARPARWIETLLAIAEHDDAEIELDGENLLTAAGGPLDYSMKHFDKSRCERLAMLTGVKSRYIALLVSLHMEFLYRDEANVNTEAARFLKEQSKIRKMMESDLGISEKEIEHTYSLLEWCDAFSLLICQGNIPPEHRSTEISTGPDGRPYNVVQWDENVLSVDPWPFETQKFDVYFEYRSIRQLAFQDSAAFRAKFKEAPVNEAHWTILRKPASGKKRSKV
jgi:hypothetical protein